MKPITRFTRSLGILQRAISLLTIAAFAACTAPPERAKDRPLPAADSPSHRPNDPVLLSYDTYAQNCKDALDIDGKGFTFPTHLQCMDGARLEVTANGAEIPDEQKNFSPATLCDRPPLLGLDGDIGQCAPNARLLVTRMGPSNEGPYFALLCRNYVYRSNAELKLNPVFDDIAMVIHNPENKQTCFFQRLASTNRYVETLTPIPGKPDLPEISGKDVPFPLGPQAKPFWEHAPDEVAQIGCARCHDANPFVRSPYVFQALKTPGAVAFPARAYGDAYGIANLDWLDGKNSKGWKVYHRYLEVDKAQRKNEEIGACLVCHSLGPGFSSGNFTEYSAGKAAPGQLPSASLALSHWMPPMPPADKPTWEKRYSSSVTFLTACNATPNSCPTHSLHP